MQVAERPVALAEALQSVPRELLLAESRLWEQVTGKKIGSKRQAEVARTIARWAFDRGLLERLLDRLEPECRLLVDLVPRAWPNLHMFLAGAAGEGHGDLLPHVPRCAALGLVVPIVRPGFSYDLWDRRQIRNPVAAHDLLVPETVFERSVSVPPVLVDVRRASRGEVLQSIPVERVLAAAAATAAAVMAAPLPLTRKGTISQRAVKRIARAAGADDRLPLGFQLAVLHHLGMLLRPRQGESARLVVEPSRLERMVTDGEALRQALLALGTGDLLGWELETGATVPESDDGFFGHYREVVATPRVRGYRAVLVHGLSAVPRSGGWIPVAELAMRLAERAPDWLVGRERWSWRREGESRWYVEPEDRRHLAALAVLHLAQTSVRLGVLELGASGSGAPQEVPIFPTCTPSIYGGGGELDDEVLAMAKGLVVRFVPPLPGLLGDSLPAATREAAPTLGSDLELQVPRGGLEYELAVLAALLGEPLPYTPGDRVLRSRITAASIVRARSIGVPVERIEGFLDLCRPAPAPAVRRRVLEWAGRAGSVTLHSGWSLAEWKSLQERDRALEVWPELRPAGPRWTLVPPFFDLHAEPEVLPAPALRLDGHGRLSLGGPVRIATAALSGLARIGSGGTVELDGGAIRELGLDAGQLRRLLRLWSGDDPSLVEALEQAIGSVLGATRPAPWSAVRLVALPSAAMARRVAAALEEGGVATMPAGGNLLVMDEAAGTELERVAASNGLRPERVELRQLVAPGPKRKGSKGAIELTLSDGTVLESLSSRALRRHLEEAAATERTVLLLARLRSQFNLVRAKVVDVDKVGGILHVFLHVPTAYGKEELVAVELRNIAAIGFPA